MLAKAEVLGVEVHAGHYRDAVEQIAGWCERGESRAVFFCNVHSVVTARSDIRHASHLRSGDLILPDGFPIARALRRRGFAGQSRISGPDIMLSYMELAAQRREKVFLLGGTNKTLELLSERLRKRYPNIDLVTYSPPFRELTANEDSALVAEINKSGAQSVWVGLGCPKQEQWISEHKTAVRAVMLGVGAAFMYHSGELRRAPDTAQKIGLEWLFRLLSDPQRLWRRYAVTNSKFLYYTAIDAIKSKF